MKSVYQRENLKITEFDKEDVITTSGVIPVDPDPTHPDEPVKPLYERENAYRSFNSFMGGSWF